MVTFEGQERRGEGIAACLKAHGLASLAEARSLLESYGIETHSIIRSIQPICFEDACWAYILGGAIAVRKGATQAAEAAAAIGEGLQAFCIPGSVADHRKVGLGHGRLASMLLREETGCFCLLAGHESFAAAEGAIGIVQSANRVRKEPLRVILNGLGKDAAYIISRINGFTYVRTDYDCATGTLAVLDNRQFSQGPRAAVRCYGPTTSRKASP